MSKTATARKVEPAEPARGNFAFGSAPARPRRKAIPPSHKSDAELIAEFLKVKQIKMCPTRYADGAVKTSGSYEF